jgi:mRNA interferase MazF
MKKGDIVLIPFPFTDLSGSKNRPALILIAKKFDTTVSFISTQINWKEDTDILLNPKNENGLKKTSIIRLSKIATIDNDLILGRLGTLNVSQIKEIDNMLIILLRLQKYFK